MCNRPGVAGKLRIGTSGWSYKHWIKAFYPERLPVSKMLHFYTGKFDTVEVNSSFYRLPPEHGLRDWRARTPPDFCFAMKGSRFLTHMKKLRDTGQGIERFFERAELLVPKLGPVLFQLPPRWPANPQRLADFLAALPRGHHYAFEFRDPSWNNGDVFDILRSHGTSYCIYDLAGYLSPLIVTARIIYVRLHGPGGKYQGSYSEEALADWAHRISSWRRAGHDVYIYFDNDQAGYAAHNALRLKELTNEIHVAEQVIGPGSRRQQG
jgi:uncharacterized protein YecE (DUF72 family)